MREAVGSSLLLNVVVFFVGIVIIFFIGVLSYSKAYRVKNRIIEIVEKYGVYDDSAKSEINQSLYKAGYALNSGDLCSSSRVQNHLINVVGLTGEENDAVANLNDNNFNYCIFEAKNKTSNGRYYIVVSFVHFEFPVIGDIINVPVYGETKILGKSYDYE